MKKTTMTVLLILLAVLAVAAWAVYQEYLGHHEDAVRAVESGGGAIAVITVCWVFFFMGDQ